MDHLCLWPAEMTGLAVVAVAEELLHPLEGVWGLLCLTGTAVGDSGGSSQRAGAGRGRQQPWVNAVINALISSAIESV